MTKIDFPLAKTDIGDAERSAVLAVLDGKRLAAGPEIGGFERAFADHCGVSHAVMLNSGTSALTIALMSLGIGPGDEVIVPSLTFIATLNGVLATGARAVLVDVDHRGLLSAESLENKLSPTIRAVVPVDLYGQCTDIPSIRQCVGPEIAVVEDAAEAIGASTSTSASDATFEAGHIQGYADAAIFGFYPNKVLTTGEGGMLVTDSVSLASQARSRINQSRTDVTDGRILHQSQLPGFSLRGNEISAAIGSVQLASLLKRLEQRRALAQTYLQRLEAFASIIEPLVTDVWATSWFTMPVLVNDNINPDDLQRCLMQSGVETARYFQALHLEPAVRATDNSIIQTTECPCAEKIAEHVLCLPFWPGLEAQLDDLMVRVGRGIAMVRSTAK